MFSGAHERVSAISSTLAELHYSTGAECAIPGDGAKALALRATESLAVVVSRLPRVQHGTSFASASTATHNRRLHLGELWRALFSAVLLFAINPCPHLIKLQAAAIEVLENLVLVVCAYVYGLHEANQDFRQYATALLMKNKFRAVCCGLDGK